MMATGATTSEKLEEARIWVDFFKEALGNPQFDEGVLYLTTADEDQREPMPSTPGAGCGRLRGLVNVGVTLPEAVLCMREIHQLLLEVQREAGLLPPHP